MTRNQIDYLKLLETQRNNKAIERLTEARDQVNRDLGFATLGETTRHNYATEQHNRSVLDETIRHNVFGEQLQVHSSRDNSSQCGC